MPLHHKVRSIRELPQKDREFEELLSRAAIRARKQAQRLTHKIQKQSGEDSSAEPPEQKRI